MDALNFLKFWRHATMATASSTVPHLVVETDSEPDEDDSFFDLELMVHDFDNKENNNANNTNNSKNEGDPEEKPVRESKVLGFLSKVADDSEVDVWKKTALSPSPNEPISKRRVLPIEPISKPQSPIALLKSAPSFRIFMFRKPKRMAPQRTQGLVKAGGDMGRTQKQEQQQQQKKKETKVFAVKLNIEEFHYSPTLSRDNSSRSYGSKLRNQGSEETKSERFSKDVLQKYLKLIKPLYVKVSKRHSDKMKFSGEPSSASPMSSPSVASVSSRKEKQGSFPAGIRVVSKHLGKSRSASAATGVASPANRSDDTLLLQHDGIQSAILHCKRSFNARDSSVAAMSSEGSTQSLRNSFEDENGANI